MGRCSFVVLAAALIGCASGTPTGGGTSEPGPTPPPPAGVPPCDGPASQPDAAPAEPPPAPPAVPPGPLMAELMGRIKLEEVRMLTRTLQDIAVGQPRRDAYLALAERTGVTDLRRFIRAVVQADHHP